MMRLVTLFILLLCFSAEAQTINSLPPANGGVASTDLLPIVHNVNGTLTTQKATVSQIFGGGGTFGPTTTFTSLTGLDPSSLAQRFSHVLNVQDDCAVAYDGTDQSVKLQACEQKALATQSCMVFPTGTVVGAFTYDTNTCIIGESGPLLQTIIQSPAGSNTTPLTSLNFSSLLGTNSSGGVGNTYFSNFTVDGNRVANSGGDCIDFYGWSPNWFNVSVENCPVYMVHSEWGDAGPTFGTEGYFVNFKGDTSGQHGWYFGGPHDSQFVNTIILDAGQTSNNTYDGFNMYKGNISMDQFHSWRRSTSNNTRYAFNDNVGSSSQAVRATNSFYEGADTADIRLTSGQNQILNAYFAPFSSTVATTGIIVLGNSNKIDGYYACTNGNVSKQVAITLGDATHSPILETFTGSTSECENGVVDFTYDGGHNYIQLQTYDSGTYPTPWIGTPKVLFNNPSDTIILNGDGGNLTSIPGNVGIGTSSPSTSYPLDVASVGAFQQARIIGIGTANPGGLIIDNRNGGNGSYLDFENAGTLKFQEGIYTDKSFLIYNSNTSNNSITIGTSGLINIGESGFKLNVASSGKVGIGSTVPRASFDLSQNSDAMILPIGTSAARPTGVNGMLRYNSTYPDLEAYIGNIWTTLTTGGANAGIDLGTSATATNPSVTGDLTSGLFSPAASTVAVATGGVEAMRVNASGNVGIGTTAPSVKLDVAAGGALVESSGTVAPNGNALVVGQQHSSTAKELIIGYDTTNDYSSIQSVHQNTANTPLALQPSGGNVGIGTTTPAVPLQVNNATGLNGIVLNNLNANVGVQVCRTGSNTGCSEYEVTSYGATQFTADNEIAFAPFNTANVLYLKGGSPVSNSLVINNGSVGIGTASPNYMLDLNASSNGPIGLNVYNTNTGTSESSRISFKNNSSVSDIGTGAYIDFSYYNDFKITNQFGNPIEFATNNIERMRIDGSGNVGIETTSPAGTLDVNGVNSYFGTAAGGSRLNGRGPDGNAGIWIQYTDDNAYYDSALNTYFRVNANSGSATAMTLLSNGNVGIGSTIPRAVLDLSQNTGAMIMPIGTTGQEPASAVNGMVRYNTTAVDLEAYIGNAWTTLTTGGAMAGLDIGTSATATNPSVTGDLTSGLFSAATSTVSVAAGGKTMLTIGTQVVNIPIGTAAASYQGSLQLNGNNGIWQDPVNASLAVGPTTLPLNLSQAGGGGNGQNNVAVGINALNANTTGGANSAVGAYALANTTTGYQNTAMGWQALVADTTGYGNTAIGANSLYANSTGNWNVAIGRYTLFSNTTGQFNIAVGVGVGQNILATGNNNILLGTDSSTDTTSSSVSNTLNIGNAIFGSSLYNSTNNGSKSSGLIGINTSTPVNTLDVYGGVAIGTTYAGVTAAPTNGMIVLGSVGIGSTSPATSLDVNGDITMETGTAGAVLCLTSTHALGHCTAAASCTSTCTCTCTAN